jgi:hypothetical protein
VPGYTDDGSWAKTDASQPHHLYAHRPGAPPGDFDAEEGVSFETSKGVKVR